MDGRYSGPKKSRGTAIGSIPEMNKTIVTSGIYERYLKVGKTVYIHLMDPKTGYPFQNNLMGVSIVTKNLVDGDALSTATFDKGLEKATSTLNKRGVPTQFLSLRIRKFM